MYEGCRVTCKDCIFNKHGFCQSLDLEISQSNNVCESFEVRIKNPSMPPFVFEEYLEWLGSDFYRPYTIDKEKIIGSAKLGEVQIDGGRLASLLPTIYQPFYKTVDLPHCRVNFPRCLVKINGHNFEIDYVNYRRRSFLNDDIIKFVHHYWKDKPKQRKYNSEYNGEYKIKQG